MGFKERLKELRLEKNISQQELGKSLNMSKMAISHWEKGNSEPSIEQLKVLAQIFDVTIDYLTGYID
ncbi:MAG: helix-turn-helix transcriptional regulator [Clostridiales bacterium]|nr:helix-turn-helix transcriptional regulator [Clostridiales bacterium]